MTRVVGKPCVIEFLEPDAGLCAPVDLDDALEDEASIDLPRGHLALGVVRVIRVVHLQLVSKLTLFPDKTLFPSAKTPGKRNFL